MPATLESATVEIVALDGGNKVRYVLSYAGAPGSDFQIDSEHNYGGVDNVTIRLVGVQIGTVEIDHGWKRGDVVLDDSGNLFSFHPKHGWCGLGSNQASARGWYPFDGSEGPHPVAPLTLLVRGKKPVTP